jgi:hypothetical protein
MRGRIAVALLLLGAGPLGAQTPLGTAFTYQGRLTDGGGPASGAYDFQFILYNAAIARLSRQARDVYEGVVTTDQRGFATLELPESFEASNRDLRYQLTVIGQFAQAIVAREIEASRFTIQTDRPEVKVSWQVTSIPKDLRGEMNQ